MEGKIYCTERGPFALTSRVFNGLLLKKYQISFYMSVLLEHVNCMTEYTFQFRVHALFLLSYEKLYLKP